MAVARRLGVRSRLGLVAAALAASLPDVDIILGLLLYRDAWKLHRQGTHTLNFALTAGALAGLAGVAGAESVDGERDLLADALTGAAVVGSHVALDRVPYVEVPVGPKLAGTPLGTWAFDAVQWASVAWLIWPRGRAADVTDSSPGPV